jgi:hypothetical protein
MESVASIHSAVNPTCQDVYTWLNAKAACGDLPASSVRLQITALNSFAECIAPDEPPDDAAFVKDNLDLLANRWSTLHPSAKSDTVRAYVTRAKGALAVYFDWRADPKGFRFERPRPRKPSSEKAEPLPPVSTPPVAAAAAASPPPPQPPPAPPGAGAGMEQHRFRLGPDRYATMVHPEDMTVAEWRRWAVNALTRCVDFNPDDPAPSLSLAVVR